MEACRLIRPGIYCFFWKKDICTFPRSDNKQGCLPVIAQCEGCTHVYNASCDNQNYCACYASPKSVWRLANVGHCPRATHIELKKAQQQKLNPLKAAKRARKQTERNP